MFENMFHFKTILNYIIFPILKCIVFLNYYEIKNTELIYLYYIIYV